MSDSVVVCGAQSFIGLRVVARLRELGKGPIILQDPSSLPEQSPIAILNCAMGRPANILTAARQVTQLANHFPAARVVHVGSMSVYGPLEGLVTETAPVSHAVGAYALAQVQAEQLLTECRNVAVLRCGVEYGPGCGPWTDRIAHLLMAGRLGDLGAAGDGICNLLYLDDLVEAIIAAMNLQSEQNQAFNLAMRNPPTWNQYFTRFALALRATPVKRIPVWRTRAESKLAAAPLRALAMAAQSLGLGSNIHALTSSLLQTCAQRITLDVSKAEEALDCRWTPLETGLANASAAVRSLV